ncbi:ATP-binding cassette domain-containing protein [Nocardioides zeae]|uniref:ATP-binding cassette domain-containing protein n=1 Tax=Nocardioides zeae TaxID=1457234 RepID=A0A6P0HNK7_9ACTN|nr:ATP-binding cassette domain-containing protein [Nocardioides zeae]
MSNGYVVRPLAGLSLDAHDGQLLVVHGPSGCGKTTLLSVLAGLLTPSEGSVTFGGEDVLAHHGSALLDYRRHQVGTVFQAFNLVASLSALENVMAPLLLTGTRRAAAAERAHQLLGQVGLAERARHRPGELSGGQQQRVAIARALVHDPPLLLADEPTAHLDHIQVEVVLSLLRDLAQPGRLVVVVTHDDRFARLADVTVELGKPAPRDAVEPLGMRLAPGEVLFRQGDVGDLVYVVESGRVEIVRELAGGAEQLLSTMGPGEYLGELAALTGVPRSATVRAGGEGAVLTAMGVADFRSRQLERAVAAGPDVPVTGTGTGV